MNYTPFLIFLGVTSCIPVAGPTPKASPSPVPTRAGLGDLIQANDQLIQQLAHLDCQLMAMDQLGCRPDNKCDSIVYDAFVNVCMRKIKGYPNFGVNK